MIIILWVPLEKGECFDFNHSLRCVYPTLYIIRLLGRVYHLSFLICYPSSSLIVFYWPKYICQGVQSTFVIICITVFILRISGHFFLFLPRMVLRKACQHDLRWRQGWYSQGKSRRKLWFSVKSGNSSGGQGEKYSLKFESQGYF